MRPQNRGAGTQGPQYTAEAAEMFILFLQMQVVGFTGETPGVQLDCNRRGANDHGSRINSPEKYEGSQGYPARNRLSMGQ